MVKKRKPYYMRPVVDMGGWKIAYFDEQIKFRVIGRIKRYG